MQQWYALRSKPRKEFTAAALLSSVGIEVYVPQANVQKRRDQPLVVEPFFPGYLFGRLDPLLGQIRLATYTKGIQYVVGYGGQACPVPDSLITTIRERLRRGIGPTTMESVRPGDRVIITSGPLKDVEAIFDCRRSATGRVHVLIEILDRVCRTELRIGQLRPIGTVAGIV